MSNGFLHENLDSDKTCDFPEELLASYADWDHTGLDEADIARIEAHLSECEHCRKVLASEQAFTALFGEVITTGSDYADSTSADKTNVEVDNDDNDHCDSAASAPAAQNGWAEFIPYGSAPMEIPEEIRQRCRQRIDRRINPERTIRGYFGRFTNTEKMGGGFAKLSRFAGIAAMLMLAFGVAWLANDLVDNLEEGQGLSSTKTTSANASGKNSLTELREKFDCLVGAGNNVASLVTQSSVEEIQGILTETEKYLNDPATPRSNLVHAWLLKSDCHGALAERDKEFKAYCTFAETLGSYYAANPTQYTGDKTPGLDIPQNVILTQLLKRGDKLYDTAQYTSAIPYFKEVEQRFPKTDFAPYALYRIGDNYLRYDLEAKGEICFEEIQKKYPLSQWSLMLLRKKAETSYKQLKWRDSAKAWLMLSQNSSDIEEKTIAELKAIGIYTELNDNKRALQLLDALLENNPKFYYRKVAEQMVFYNYNKTQKLMVKNISL